MPTVQKIKGKAAERGSESQQQGPQSRVRARVEHVFAHMQNSMGGIFMRTIGITRAKVAVTLMNLTYNLSRIELLIRNKTFGFERISAQKMAAVT